MRTDPDKSPNAAIGIAEDFEALDGAHHTHQRAQLLHAVEGVMSVITAAGLFVVPSSRAVFVPGGTRHKVSSKRPFRLRTVYFDQARFADLPREVSVVPVPPLLRELIVAVTQFRGRWAEGSRQARLVGVLLDELAAQRAAPLSLPAASDPRVRKVCEALSRDPKDPRELAQWARVAGASERNLARLFVRDTGLTFGAWRTQLRLLRAVESLAEGTPVSAVASDLGYESASAFSTMFRRAFGVAPARYFDAPSHTPSPDHERRG